MNKSHPHIFLALIGLIAGFCLGFSYNSWVTFGENYQSNLMRTQENALKMHFKFPKSLVSNKETLKPLDRIIVEVNVGLKDKDKDKDSIYGKDLKDKDKTLILSKDYLSNYSIFDEGHEILSLDSCQDLLVIANKRHLNDLYYDSREDFLKTDTPVLF